MSRRFVVAILVILTAVSAVGAIKSNEPGVLAGYIAVGASPEFLKDWARPGSPTVPLVKQFRIGDTAYIAFIVTGILPDQAGQANVTVDFRIARPDGSVMFEKKAYARVAGPASRVPNFDIADPALDLSFDSTDLPGTYSIVAIFHDAVSKKGALCEVRIELIAKQA